jgi:solute:Na+ symporter, SSS family
MLTVPENLISGLDVGIIICYLIVIIIAGIWLSKKAGENIDSYFLGGKSIPWYYLGIANASGMFDIAGTMWMVTLFFIYGVKSAWIPWLWPTFNQIFLMIYLAVWLRRSNVMTGAAWIRTRFGDKAGGELSHISVVIFALIAVFAFLAYSFQGIGKFAAIFFPWDISWAIGSLQITSANSYALIFMGITTVYVIMGGMYSVVLTDLIQFTILTIVSVFIAVIAMSKVSPEVIDSLVPGNWHNLSFGSHLEMNWTGMLSSINDNLANDGYSLFGIFFMMILLKGILSSMAGPAPNYDMQKVLSTRSPKEAALMSWCTSAVLLVPRYLLVAGIGIIAIAFYKSGELMTANGTVDFEQILPYVINNHLPAGLVGFVLAGLLAAFMSTFDCTVNAGASYVVNDIYKRYINPDASPKVYVYMSYLASILIVVVGITFGFFLGSIDVILKWITVGLYGGYVASNVLKWYWWRFNGFGYFAGMITGIAMATLFSELTFKTFFNDFYMQYLEKTDHFPIVLACFPIMLILSTAAAIIVSLLTKPDEENVLKDFYKNVRPWGFWGPIHKKVVQEDPSFESDACFKRDMVNVVVGIIWQMSLIVLPIFFILRDHKSVITSVIVLTITSIILRKNWYNKLQEN